MILKVSIFFHEAPLPVHFSRWHITLLKRDSKHFYLRRFSNIFTCIALAKADLVVGPLHPSVCPQHFWGA